MFQRWVSLCTDAMSTLGQDVFPCLRAQDTYFDAKFIFGTPIYAGCMVFLSRISRSDPAMVLDLESDEEIYEAHSTTGAAVLML